MSRHRILSRPKRDSLIVASLLAVLLLHYSCRHKPIVPEKPVSFSRDILSIIGGNCSQQGCHGSSNAEFPLLSYDQMMKDDRIVPNDPYNSKIYLAITSSFGENVMPPPPQQPLTTEQISIIYTWIIQGAPNN
jgi:hypothetical protein